MELKMLFESNAKENFCTVDGKRYATGENGKCLYQLIDPSIAYFPGETMLIDENFVVKNQATAEDEIKKAVHKALKKQ